MRYAGIDIASETHAVAVVDADGTVESKPTLFAEDATGYQTALRVLGAPGDVLIAMEATGHYWKNLFAALAAAGHAVALLNPLRTHRFAGEDLTRTKTDTIDALSIARFAAQKQPLPTHLPDPATEELRELVRLRQRLLQDFGDRVRQLHRLVDLGFPEFTRYVHGLNTELASAILHDYPTAAAFHGVAVKRLAALRYDGTHRVGIDLARALIDAARHSVGQHHSAAYRVQVRYACQDLDLLRRRLRELDRDIDSKLREHAVGTLLTTIDGIGPHTAAYLIAELGDPAHFATAGALAAYVGVIPGLRQSGKRHTLRAPLTPIGNARLRAALWMPTLTAVRYNPWLRAYYQQLRARGKLPKVALVACMHKLLFAIYSVAKHRRPFVPQLTALGTTP
ncbi:MAG: IS110 family transposase [Betaproteobacteria bacterium]|nr:IS110 family transposase [Betaproteobacteria bacterium]MDE2002683.1 IS110 family transposase [Betaproteobacteria bacterium]MDE2358992.1 IS110 family transposase [Betaproteobacteria bacterium]